MANTAERDGDYAVKNYEDWREIAARLDDPGLVQRAFETAWNMGQAQGERDGWKDAQHDGVSFL